MSYAARISTLRVPFVWLVPLIAVPAAVTKPLWHSWQLVASVPFEVCFAWLFAVADPAAPLA